MSNLTSKRLFNTDKPISFSKNLHKYFVNVLVKSYKVVISREFDQYTFSFHFL